MPAYSGKIWITGIGCISAAGFDLEDSMQALLGGVRPQVSPHMFDAPGVDYPVCAVKPEWLASAGAGWWSGSVAATLSLAEIAARQAVEQALEGCEAPDFSGMGVSIGTTAGNALHFLDGYRKYREGQCVDPKTYLDVRSFISGNLASSLGQRYRADGPVLTASNACTSGTDAIGTAMEWLRLGLCDQVLAGGSDALSVIPYIGFNRLMIYAPEACKPFDKNRQGLNLGEGAAVFLLEREDSALRRGAKPRGFVAGYGAGSDAHHFTAPHPEGRGLEQAIGKAMLDAGISTEDLAFVNAHGTSTKENDKVEGAALNRLLPEVPVWGSKGSTGHCLGAAGAIEAAFSVGALERSMVPPTAGCEKPEDFIRDRLVLSPLPVQKKYALSVSLGFGGGNAALVIEKV